MTKMKDASITWCLLATLTKLDIDAWDERIHMSKLEHEYDDGPFYAWDDPKEG